MPNERYRPHQSNDSFEPVSPLEGNGETWQHPDDQTRPVSPLSFTSEPRKNPPNTFTQPKGSRIVQERPFKKDHNKNRLSRPFDQPAYPSEPSHQHRQPSPPRTNVPMQADMKRAHSHLRNQPAQAPTRKPAPATLTIPAPVHQSRHHREPNPHRDKHAPAERHDHRSKKKSQVQGHRGWDPEGQLNRDFPTKRKNHRGRERDLERQDEFAHLPKASDKAGRRCCIWLVVVALLVLAIIIIVLVRNKHHK